MMSVQAGKVIDGIRRAMEATGAGHCFVALKSHYHDAISALNAVLGGDPSITLHRSDTYYPAGDEKQIIFEITGKVVPTAGLPLDAGIVVLNIGTLAAISDAMEGIPFTERLVTVGGAVRSPVTLMVPIGTPFSVLMKCAGGVTEECRYIEGGPLMGKVYKSEYGHVSKTTSGLIALPVNHPLIKNKTGEMNLQLIKSVCCQCTMCTQLCPRNSLGLGTAPHKAMLSFAYGTDLVPDENSILSCCDCGICSYYACNFGLKPAMVMGILKNKMGEAGIKPEAKAPGRLDAALYSKRIPTKRMISRTGLSVYDVPAGLGEDGLEVREVNIPLKQHIGAQSVPVVNQGQRINKGDLIADIPEGKLGAKIHASISGTVKITMEDSIGIEV
jgi:Na+-translocating ferredoxin:NAD+ oxidoreductase RnfC subunit